MDVREAACVLDVSARVVRSLCRSGGDGVLYSKNIGKTNKLEITLFSKEKRLSPVTASKITGFSRQTILSMIYRGALRSDKIRKQQRIPASEIEKLVMARGIQKCF